MLKRNLENNRFHVFTFGWKTWLNLFLWFIIFFFLLEKLMNKYYMNEIQNHCLLLISCFQTPKVLVGFTTYGYCKKRNKIILTLRVVFQKKFFLQKLQEILFDESYKFHDSNTTSETGIEYLIIILYIYADILVNCIHGYVNVS